MRSDVKRILYVQRPDGGGSAVSLRHLIERLDRSRFEPVVLLHEEGRSVEEFRAVGARVLVLDDRRARRADRSDAPARGGPFMPTRRFVQRDLPTALQVARLIRAERISLVHHNNNPRANRLSILGASIARTPQICHARSLRSGTAVDRRLARSVARFIYVSRAVQDRFQANGFPTARGEVIYDPVDVQAFGRSEDASNLRSVLGIAAGDRVVTNIGRLVRWKGQDGFLRAMGEVMSIRPNVKALLVGEANATPESQRFERELLELAADLGIANRVIFTGYRTDIPAIVSLSDVLVHSSSEPEPLGLVVVEAMAGGRPVVATDGGGVPELLEHRATGMLVPLRADHRMAEAIGDLLDSPVLARRVGRRARSAVRHRFDLGRHAQAVENVYARVLASGE